LRIVSKNPWTPWGLWRGSLSGSRDGKDSVGLAWSWDSGVVGKLFML